MLNHDHADIGMVPPRQSVKMLTDKQCNPLTEKARMFYHDAASLLPGHCCS